MSKDECLKMLMGAIDNVYKKEYFLIQSDIGEWSVAAQLFYYLKKDCSCELDVDSEYNKMIRDGVYSGGQLIKRMDEKDEDGNPIRIRPDIIVHKRGPSATRLLWAEVKREEGESNEKDLVKIVKVTQPYKRTAEYVTGYDYGASIILGKMKVRVIFISRGSDDTDMRVGCYTNGGILWKKGIENE